MKFLSFTILALVSGFILINSNPANAVNKIDAATMWVIPGSCTQPLSQGLDATSECEVLSLVDGGSLFRATVSVNILTCYDFQGFQSNERCRFPAPGATCVLTNRSYQDACVENIEVAFGLTADKACAEVLECLSSVGCLKNYCNSTQIRTGWSLLKVVSHN